VYEISTCVFVCLFRGKFCISCCYCDSSMETHVWYVIGITIKIYVTKTQSEKETIMVGWLCEWLYRTHMVINLGLMPYLYLIDAIYSSSGRCNTCKLSGVVCVDISVYLGTSRCVVYVWLFFPLSVRGGFLFLG
jgi:hypothetical protein